ncbi:hypothetical protein [Maribellus sp. YY47]|uniref:hypothetical protein n=1 Tax=Maribellus sp. YY47 TaxID=2929486 RepID=UPI0020017452|nr:hypothetical protein [Maribellus sp. YY47]MCK3683400.1 hypothetical protein [Maribellus sp. YY47]
MKYPVVLLSLIITLSITSCHNASKKSEEIASYTYKEEKVEMNSKLRANIPQWVKEGTICYGLVVQVDGNDNPVKGKPVKAKVVQMGRDAIKMKALETVSLVEVEGCTKMGISKGETWDENEGDLYLSFEEAVDALKKMKIYKISDRATVD